MSTHYEHLTFHDEDDNIDIARNRYNDTQTTSATYHGGQHIGQGVSSSSSSYHHIEGTEMAGIPHFSMQGIRDTGRDTGLHVNNTGLREMISGLSLDDLLKYHPGVRDLNALLKNVTKSMAAQSEMNSQLYTRVQSLELELQELRVRSNTPSPYNLPFRGTGSKTPSHLSNSLIRADSVSPSDSISQTLSQALPSTTAPRPVDRPSQYPVSVLWTISDAKEDPDISSKTSGNGNHSRMPVPICIRHEDGTTINDTTWKSIKASGQIIITGKLEPLQDPLSRPSQKSHKPATRGKKWYVNNHKAAWFNAIQELEQQQPLLRLCAVSWKAEAVLQHLITSDNSARKLRETRALRAQKRTKDQDHDVNPDSKGSDTRSRSASTTGAGSGAGDSPPQTIISATTSGSRPAKRYRNGAPSDAGLEHPSKKIRSPETAPSATGTNGLDFMDVEPPRTDANSLRTQAILSGLNSIQSVSGMSELPSAVGAPAKVDTRFIVVSQSLSDLKDTLLSEFPHIKSTALLFKAMSTASNIGDGVPSEMVLQFIARIEGADPSDDTLDEDDKDMSWGHYQFTAGSMTCTSVMKLWSDIGNIATACRLIAAAIRTSKVARYVCERKGLVGSFLSDVYLEAVVELLWELWQKAHHNQNVSIPNPASGSTVVPPAAHVPGASTPPESEPTALPESTTEHSNQTRDRDILHDLQVNELKTWIQDNNIMLPTGRAGRLKREDYINAILASSSPKPTKDDVEYIVRIRSSRRQKKKALDG